VRGEEGRGEEVGEEGDEGDEGGGEMTDFSLVAVYSVFDFFGGVAEEVVCLALSSFVC